MPATSHHRSARAFAWGALTFGGAGLALVAFAQTTIADARKIIPYQGELTLDEAVVDGTTTFSFSLYDAPTGGDALWTEEQPLEVVRGRFATTFGAAAPLPDDVFAADELFLAIGVEGTTLAGRQQVFAVPYAARANNGVPPGTITAFAGPTANVPEGWRLCDGAAISANTYPELFAAIGTAWGDGGDGTGALFHLPDGRGAFLRGVSGASTRDPDRATRAASAAGGNTGNEVGTTQLGALDAHAHDTSDLKVDSSGAHTHTWDGYFTVAPSGGIEVQSRTAFPASPSDVTTNSGGAHTHTLSGTLAESGGSETRPVNVAVNWIIKL